MTHINPSPDYTAWGVERMAKSILTKKIKKKIGHIGESLMTEKTIWYCETMQSKNEEVPRDNRQREKPKKHWQKMLLLDVFS